MPSDSELVGQTWQYVNVKGGPDRRFKNNRQLPILRYGRLTLTGEAGYQAVFDFSTMSASSALAGALQEMAPAQRDGRRNPAPLPHTPTHGYGSSGNANSMRPTALRLSRRRLSADGRVPVVGESHYQSALHSLANGIAVGNDFNQHLQVFAILLPEPENPHDRNAAR